MSTNETVLRDAIKNRKLVMMKYDNQKHYRYVMPFYILTNDSGSLYVFTLQVENDDSIDRPEFRMFKLSKIDSVDIIVSKYPPIPNGYKEV